uniref:Uncharacterized protein n=1 Tax=viral metagenome TaxID=1070528 RepID=A0A6M3LT60_9ZZZZ
MELKNNSYSLPRLGKHPTGADVMEYFEILRVCDDRRAKEMCALMDYMGLEFKDEPAHRIVVKEKKEDKP